MKLFKKSIFAGIVGSILMSSAFISCNNGPAAPASYDDSAAYPDVFDIRHIDALDDAIDKNEISSDSLKDLGDPVSVSENIYNLKAELADGTKVSTVLLFPGFMNENTESVKTSYNNNECLILFSPVPSEVGKLYDLIGIPEEYRTTVINKTPLLFLMQDKDGNSYSFQNSLLNFMESESDSSSTEKHSYYAVKNSDGKFDIFDSESETEEKIDTVDSASYSIGDSELKADPYVLTTLFDGNSCYYYDSNTDKVASFTIESKASEEKEDEYGDDDDFYILAYGLESLFNTIKSYNDEQSDQTLQNSYYIAKDEVKTEDKLDPLKYVKAYKVTASFTGGIYAPNSKEYWSKNQFYPTGKTYQVRLQIQSFYNFDDNKDYYAVSQVCSFNNGPKYDKYWAGTRFHLQACFPDQQGNTWYVGQGEVIQNFAKTIEVSTGFNQVQDKTITHKVEEREDPFWYTEKISKTSIKEDVDFYVQNGNKPRPEAYNNEEKHSYSKGFNINANLSGEFGGEKGKPGGKIGASLGFGYSENETREWVTRDVEVELDISNPAWATWKYKYKQPVQNMAAGKWQRLIDGADLGHSTHQPEQFFVWCVPYNEENRNKRTVAVKIFAEVGALATHNSGSKGPRDFKTRFYDMAVFNLPPAPDFAISASEIEFPKTPTSRTLFAKAAAGKKIEITSNAEFDKYFTKDILNIEDGKKVIIQTRQENTDGATRKGELTLTCGGKTSVVQILQLFTN